MSTVNIRQTHNLSNNKQSDLNAIIPVGFPEFLDAVEAKPCGGQWAALCPAHDDRRPSLSIALGENGGILLHCFAGCEFDDVTTALSSRGLWPVRVDEGRPSLPTRNEKGGLPPGLLEFDAKLV